jgi:sulfur relay (sulfurtransferase) DsrF/TusC family protein
MDDGVFNALKDQSTGNIGMPRISDAIEDLLSLDVKILCISEHLKERNIQKEDLIDDLVFIHEDEIPGLSMESDCVTTF